MQVLSRVPIVAEELFYTTVVVESIPSSFPPPVHTTAAQPDLLFADKAFSCLVWIVFVSLVGHKLFYKIV